MMRLFLCCSFLFGFNALSHGQDTLRALFIGNSYMAVNNLPTLVSEVANAQGDYLIYDSNTPGGQTFQMHANNAINYQKMQAQAWDYIILQGQSQEPSFPYEQVNTQTLPYALQLADSAKSIQPCSQVNFFMTWGRQNGDPQWDSINTFDKMNARLRAAYLRIADSAAAAVSPVGVAWKFVRDNYPNINLYQQDGSHPSLEGSYLAACVFYSALFQKSCLNNTFNPGIGHGDAFILQQVASNIVLDSLGTWGLVLPSEQLQVTAGYSSIPGASLLSFTANADQAANYTWYFPDMTIEVGQNIGFEYNLNTYQVLLIATGLCDTDTLLIDVNLSSTSGLDLETLQYEWKPGAALQLNSSGFNTIKGYDLLGKEVPLAIEKGQNGFLIAYPTTCCMLQLANENQNYVLRTPLTVAP